MFFSSTESNSCKKVMLKRNLKDTNEIGAEKAEIPKNVQRGRKQ